MTALASGYPFVPSLPPDTRMSDKTPRQITNFLDASLHRFDTPDVYYGDEPNTFHWNEAEWNAASLRGVIQAPFDYLQAIGNNTIPLLYQIINEYNSKTWVTERSYFPTSPDEVRLLERSGMPLWGLETRHPLGTYDWIGVTLNYPVYYNNIVKALRMSQIPVRAVERERLDQEYPLVILGGHVFADPWFPAPVADIVFLGEAEDETKEGYASAPAIFDEKAPHTSFKQHEPVDNPGLLAVLRELDGYKAKGWYYDPAGREQMLHELGAKYPFLFIPRFYHLKHTKSERRTHEGENGWRLDQQAPWSKRYVDLPTRPTKRFVRNLDAVPILTKPPVPFHDPKMGLGQAQIARGCSYHCNFSVTPDTEVFIPGHGIWDIDCVELGDSVATDGIPQIVRSVLDEGVLPAKRVTLYNGLQITASLSHRFRVLDRSGRYVWIHTDELEPGHVVPVQYGMECWGEYQELATADVTQVTEKHFTRDSYRYGGKPHDGVKSVGSGDFKATELPRQPARFDERLAYVLGNWMGDGSVHKNGRTLMWAAQERCALRLAQYLDELFGVKVTVRKDSRGIQMWWVEVHSKHLVQWFDRVLGVRWPKKEFVPDIVMHSPRSVAEAFIEGWWDADGYVAMTAAGQADYLTNKNVEPLRRLMLLLLNMGYKPSIVTVKPSGTIRNALGHDVYRLRRNVENHMAWFREPSGDGRRSRAAQVPVPDVPLHACSEVGEYDFRLRSRQFLTRVTAVEELEPQPMYDIGVDGETFIARGLVSHNCAASYREAPYRERSQSLMVERFRDIMYWTGAYEVSPLTLELGTYSRKKALMKQVLEEVTPNLSMPSLRIDVFGGDPVFGQLAVHAQKKNVTIAVEGNSQKMREVVSKGITEEDVLRSFSYAIAAGYESAKLYMIANLPGETEEDLKEIVELCKKLDAMRRSTGSTIRVRLSWKPLTIQANMPLQWFPARAWSASIADSMKEITALGFGAMLGDEARSGMGNFIQLAELADDVAGEALLDAILRLNKPSFGSMPKVMFALLEEELAKRERNFADYYRRKDTDEVFGWDLVNTHITKGYLLRHYRKILSRVNDEPIPIYGNGFLEKFGGCAIGCTACGACDKSQLEVMSEFAGRTDDPVKLSDIKKLDRTTVRQKVILTVDVSTAKRFVTRKHWRFALQRAMYQSGIQFAHGAIHFITEDIKTQKSIFSGRDYVEVGLSRPEIDWAGIPERLNKVFDSYNAGFRVVEIHPLGLSDSLKAMRIDALLWQLECNQNPLLLQQAVAEIPNLEMSYKIEKYRQGVVIERIPLKQALIDAWISGSGRSMNLSLLMRPEYSPFDAANSLIGKRTDVYRYPAQLQTALSGIWHKDIDVFTKLCLECGAPVPTEFRRPYGERCPRCADLVSVAVLSQTLVEV